MSDNQFIKNMKSYGLGSLLDEAAREQDKIVEAVRTTGKAGKLTMTLNFKRTGQHGVTVSPDIKSSIPRKPLQAVEMYATDDNKLHDDNPDQLTHDDVIRMEDKRPVNQVGT